MHAESIIPPHRVASPPKLQDRMLRSISPACLSGVSPSRICIIKPSALGDVVQAMPLLPALRERFPDASITWVVNRELSPLLAGHPAITDVVPFDRHGGWSAAVRLLANLHRRRFDLVLDLQGLLRTGLMSAATGAKWRVGLETAREGAGLACHCLIPGTGRDVPAHARYWNVAGALGISGPPRNVGIPQDKADSDWAASRLQSLPRPLLAIHPGARWVTKRWPQEKFAAIAARFCQETGGAVVVVGSGSERELASGITERVVAGSGAAINLAGDTTLRQLASVLKSVDLLVSNDSGPMHLGAAQGTPVVGIFTCTDSRLSGPDPGQNGSLRHELVSTQVVCAASYRKNCPFPGRDHLACLEELPVLRVWDAVQRSLTRHAVRSRVA